VKSVVATIFATLILVGVAVTYAAVLLDGATVSTQTHDAVASNVPDLPRLPGRWTKRGMHLGMADGPGGAERMSRTARFGFRYTYLSGGVNTGQGWANWDPDGTYATRYIRESLSHKMTPVFSYYMMLQSQPGRGQPEATADFTNLQDPSTMTAYYQDLKLFFRRAGAFSRNVVLHVEPDLWGYMQQRAPNRSAQTVPAQVSATGLPVLAGLPNNLSGFARAIVRLRNTYAPNVLLAYSLSVWGTGVDIAYSNPSRPVVDALAVRAGDFYLSLKAGFDIAIAEFGDRDAAFKQYVDGDGGASWWGPGDYRRNVRFISQFVKRAGKRVVMWQIPFGNTRMRAMNNTWGHYQDNRVEWLLDGAVREHLRQYARAGVLAFLFGGGFPGTTCACDEVDDGKTNPAPINGNNMASLNADDDGGYFRHRAAAYYRLGMIPLPE
jgi:hypothetical protein